MIGALLGDGHPFGWSLRLLQGSVTVAVAGTLARRSRRSPASIYAVPFATALCRLLLARAQLRGWLEAGVRPLGGLRTSVTAADR